MNDCNDYTTVMWHSECGRFTMLKHRAHNARGRARTLCKASYTLIDNHTHGSPIKSWANSWTKARNAEMLEIIKDKPPV